MLDLTTLIETGGLLAILAVVFAESGLFVGFFLPGDSLLFTAGMLASRGLIDPVLLFLCVPLAAILGDSVGYWFGRKVGPALFSRPHSRFFSHARLEETKTFFARYGAKSVLLARFVPAVRTFTPILAGVGEMPYRTFLSYNIIGGLVWGAGLPLLGYFLGNSVPGIDRFILPIILVIVAVSFLPILLPLLRRSGFPVPRVLAGLGVVALILFGGWLHFSSALSPRSEASLSPLLPSENEGQLPPTPLAPPSLSLIPIFVYDAAKDRDAGGNIRCSKEGLVTVLRPLAGEDTLAARVRLLLGSTLSEEERARGLTSEFPLEGVSLVAVLETDDAATLVLDDPEAKTSGGACRASILAAQVTATALPKSAGRAVRFSPNTLFQP